MHHIQVKILKKLLFVPESNYAGLRPDGVESNHFAYHLEQLLRSGLLRKQDKAYCLTATGLAYIDRLSQGKMVARLQPHIVTAIDLTAPDGETLLFRRSFQPYLHLVGFPLGKIHFEESIAEAASRELQEKTGLAGIPLTQRGMAYIQVSQGDVTIGKVLYHVFHADVPEHLTTVTPPDRGECFWGDHRTIESATLMPGFLRIKELLTKREQLFFDEIQVQLR